MLSSKSSVIFRFTFKAVASFGLMLVMGMRFVALFLHVDLLWFPYTNTVLLGWKEQ